MKIILLIFAAIILIIAISTVASLFASKRRLRFIQNYEFRPSLAEKVKSKYPHLEDKDTELVLKALRDYFYFCHVAENRMVSMPSQVVDVAWHEFILFTREYQKFCESAFGRFLHHTPTEAMKTKTLAQEGIKRVWRLACEKEKIDPKKPHCLPLIFAIDGQLQIEDGFKYSLDCKDKSSPNYGDGYCASHIGCSSDCGGGGYGDDSVGDMGDVGDGGGDGCGGGGCGGD